MSGQTTRVLLVSTYDLGRQPFGLASPASWLKRAGFDVRMVDLSRDKLEDDDLSGAALVAFYLPMHTATRLALPVIDRFRSSQPKVMLCAYGLYAPLNEALLRERGVSVVLGPEAEDDLVRVARSITNASPLAHPARMAPLPSLGRLARLSFITPDRAGLPPLSRYASVQMPNGDRRVAGSTDATRGCKHLCRHCPIVPVYNGQFRVVPVDVVLADIRAQVAQGAQHITFGDPDFFNGPTHARRIVEALHAEHRSLTFDVTIKIEHLLAHRELLPMLARSGCLFVTSAVESVDDVVLAHLDKGHTRADFVHAARLCQDAGLTLAPTFVAFTPWTTIDGYLDLLDVVDRLGLAGHVAPVQWGIRLLTWQSRLLELRDIQRLVGPFDAHTLTYPWRHADPRVDELQQKVMNFVGVGLTRPRLETFAAVRTLVTGEPAPLSAQPLPSRSTIPYLNEPWTVERSPSQSRLLWCRQESWNLKVKRVLLLATTTGYQTRMFADAAARLGVELVYATDRCDQLDDPWRDEAIPGRFHDEERSAAAILEAVATRPIDGVLPVGDRPTVLAALVARALNLPGHPPEAARAARDKRLSRRRFDAEGLPGPSCLTMPASSDPAVILPRVSFPVVVKPTVLSGSRGVMRADDEAGFRTAVQRLQRLLESEDVRELRDEAADTIQIEGFIPGAEYALEGVLDRGHLQTLAIFDKPDPLDGPFFEETIYVTPSRSTAQRAIAAAVGTAARALGLFHGPIHAECRVNDLGVYVLEVAARPIGGLCARALRFVGERGARCSLEEVLLRHAIGESIALWRLDPEASAVMMIPIPKGGVYRRVRGVADARAVLGVEEVRITAKTDQRLVPLPEGASYLGFIFARAKTPADAEHAVRLAHEQLQFEIDPLIEVNAVSS